MPNLHTDKDCCGCTACVSICPKDALRMTPDTIGFVYPQINQDRCIECGLCEKVCAFHDKYETPNNFKLPIPYGVRVKDEEELMKSRSGGAFMAFSDWILDKGGVIYGVGFKDHFRVAHKKAINSEERDEFRGSKYVQSDLEGIFRDIKKDLQDGLWVLFSGTPCQTAGLLSFIPAKLKERLLTVDIVCHGVPSPKMWHDYIEYIEKNEKKEIIGVDFRDKKRFGWHAHRETFKLFDPVTSTTITKSYEYKFYHHVMQRPSCGECKYCNLRRPSDLTLADFWGWEKTGTDINADDKGLSLVLVNTQKGLDVFEAQSEMLNIITPNLEDCMQEHLISPTPPKPHDKDFQRDYETYGFEYVMRKYGNIGLKYKFKKKIKGIIYKITGILR